MGTLQHLPGDIGNGALLVSGYRERFEPRALNQHLQLVDAFHERVAQHADFPLRDTPSQCLQVGVQPADDDRRARDCFLNAIEFAPALDGFGVEQPRRSGGGVVLLDARQVLVWELRPALLRQVADSEHIEIDRRMHNPNACQKVRRFSEDRRLAGAHVPRNHDYRHIVRHASPSRLGPLNCELPRPL
jgi:hypothetical protein